MLPLLKKHLYLKMNNISKILPIKKIEIPKFLTISSMMLMIIFIYSVERIVKDTIVINEMGAELISAIKLYGTLPSAVLAMIIYTKLSNEINKTKIFHIFNSAFVSYFLIFSFILAPNTEYIHMNLSSVKQNYPFLRYFVSIIENWSYSLYFILAELWGSVMLSLVFWQTANQVFKIDEAKRLYPLFGLVAQLGMISSGKLLELFSNKEVFQGGWQQSLEYINLSVLIAACFLSALYWVLTNKLVSKDIINAEIIKSKKKKPGFIESLKHVFSSKYIALIVILVLCYGVSINIVEGVWKAQAAAVYTDKQDYVRFMANLQTYTGYVCMVAMLTGSYILRLVSWKTAALFTPVMILTTGTIFYVFSIYQVEIAGLMPFLSVAPIAIAVFIGLLQNVLAKATKYAFFDSTKEMAYIPLDEALKSKGKAAADVIGGRLGKSGGALIQQFLLILALSFNPSISYLSPGQALISLSNILFMIFIIVMFLWIFSVHLLAKEFDKITEDKFKK